MATQKLKKLVEQTMKNMEVSPEDHRGFSEAKKKIKPGVSASTLREKYLSLDKGGAADTKSKKQKKDAKPKLQDDVDVAIITKKIKDNDSPANAEKRTIIASKDKGLLGSQG